MERNEWLASGGGLFEALEKEQLELDRARIQFLQQARNRVEVLRCALRAPSRRRAALRILPFLSVDERLQLFDDLLEVASVGHADYALARDQILQLPRDWLLANIEAHAERLLSGTEPWEEYRRLLELYSEVDSELTRRLAIRATQHEDPDVREAGEDFLELLRSRSPA